MRTNDWTAEHPAWPLSARKIFQRCGSVLLNTVFAVLGTAGIEAVVSPIYRPQSGQSAIVKAWILDVTVEAVLGVIVQHSRENPVIRWSWVIPAVAFAARALTYPDSASNIFGHFSGQSCAIELQGAPCTDFFLFTVPLIRGLSYSFASRLVAHSNRFSGPT
jgi:hypothetical protein